MKTALLFGSSGLVGGHLLNQSQNVEYKLSEFGNSAIPIISALKKWSLGRKKEILKKQVKLR